MKGGLPMVMEKGAGVVDRLMAVYRSVVEDNLMFSIVIIVVLYKDSVQFGIRVLVMSSCTSFEQGINVDTMAM